MGGVWKWEVGSGKWEVCLSVCAYLVPATDGGHYGHVGEELEEPERQHVHVAVELRQTVYELLNTTHHNKQ